MSSLSALPLLKAGSLPWKPPLQEPAAKLHGDLARVDPDAFEQAVAAAVRQRMAALARGILAYRKHPYRRDLPDPPVAWQAGTTRLLDYGNSAGKSGGNSGGTRDNGSTPRPVLVVPSLINRGYILDLTAGCSLLRWLSGQNLRPFLVDWGRPGPEERAFTLTDYIAGRLESALDTVIADTGERPLLLGYCMGGLLALALAQRRQRDLDGLVLMATPWDFHSDGGAQGLLAVAGLASILPLLDNFGEMPVDLIQMLFACLDPQQALRKFIAFSRLQQNSDKGAAFVALEDWLNDGVALAAPVARECLSGWYGENTPAKGLWQVAGTAIDPALVTLPSLNLIPSQDRIVPPASALALARALPNAESITLPFGHIGMVASSRARGGVWEPLAQWLSSCPKGT